MLGTDGGREGGTDRRATLAATGVLFVKHGSAAAVAHFADFLCFFLLSPSGQRRRMRLTSGRTDRTYECTPGTTLDTRVLNNKKDLRTLCLTAKNKFSMRIIWGVGVGVGVGLEGGVATR